MDPPACSLLPRLAPQSRTHLHTSSHAPSLSPNLLPRTPSHTQPITRPHTPTQIAPQHARTHFPYHTPPHPISQVGFVGGIRQFSMEPAVSEISAVSPPAALSARRWSVTSDERSSRRACDLTLTLTLNLALAPTQTPAPGSALTRALELPLAQCKPAP